MATAAGPKIVTDGLVFGYDTNYGVADNATGTRFYPGEPVANMLNYGDNFNSWIKARNSGSNPTVDVKVKEGPFKNTLADRLSLPSDGSYPRIYQNFTPASTATHTFSVWLKGETPSQGCFVGAFRNSPWSLPSSTNFSITNEWVNYSFNINPQDTSSMQLYLGSHNSHGGKSFLIYGAQLETGSTKSVFIDGTRSSTQSLIDLKETTDIDVSNASFDSTGQPTFDGTNDVITTSFPATTIPNVTIEAVVYRNQATTRYEAIVQNNNAGDDALYVNPSGLLMFWPCGSSSLTVPTGQWSHVAVSYNGTTLTYIVNGTTQVVTATCSHITDWDFLRVGGHGTTDSERWIGKIAVAKVYEKSLSAAELTQNYNAYKNRFDI